MTNKIKVVYTDDGEIKVIRGELVSEELHLVTVKGKDTDKIISIGKSVITKIERGIDY